MNLSQKTELILKTTNSLISKMKAEANIWLFHGEGGRFSSVAFSSRLNAEQWIELHTLSGILTCYPINKGVYDWSIENKYFAPTKEEHNTSGFIQRFSSGSQEHYHYLNGQQE